MAVDSEDKRRSAISHNMLSFTIRPIADGAISTSDRRHSTGYYRGIDTTVKTFFFWREDNDQGETYQVDADASWSNLSDDNSSSTWVKTQEIRDEV